MIPGPTARTRFACTGSTDTLDAWDLQDLLAALPPDDKARLARRRPPPPQLEEGATWPVAEAAAAVQLVAHQSALTDAVLGTRTDHAALAELVLQARTWLASLDANGTLTVEAGPGSLRLS